MTAEGNKILGTVLLDMSVSLDGFVAGPGDDVERLHRWVFTGAGTENMRFSDELHEVLAEVDAGAVLAGRRTFDLASGWGGDPAMKVPHVILSHDVPDEVASGKWTSFVFESGIEAAVARARKLAGGRAVYVLGGAGLAQQCLNAGLLDELQMHVVPVLLGKGIRLFDHLDARTELRLISAATGTETVRMRYQVVK
ncbi:dihydrofolate reductase family protein [Amycolatopsis sp. NBC_01488]|uniref:dihydrofolate reductase family protein n=1 Tax=Amycolatopsis sp. NBC_01488 TaxID=2903563 RepID=UPI002E298524|nr:dihydrofolate reductase family protein [Amycolatopsis sp. NBC_01488]